MDLHKTLEALMNTNAFDIKMLTLIIIYLFLPLSALTYYAFRHRRHMAKVRRIVTVLEVEQDVADSYSEQFPGVHLLLAVVYSSFVCIVGLMALMFNDHVEGALRSAQGAGTAPTFPVDDSLLMLGMAILGAYLWGMQYVYRRYMSNDLNPGVFYGLSMRMLLAGALAVIIYNAYEALAGAGGDPATAGQGIGKSVWPALAFILGMFPQRGLAWLRERIPFFSPEKNETVRALPLEMIEGIEIHDRLRLEECGLDSCHDLATTDFVPLAIGTPYSARTLIDWILQAKLCVYAGDAMGDLRNYGIRTIVDLEGMNDKDLETLALETSVTRPALDQAMRYLERAPEVPRLRKIGHLMGIFAGAVPDGVLVREPRDTESHGNVWHAAPRDGVEPAPRTRPSV